MIAERRIILRSTIELLKQRTGLSEEVMLRKLRHLIGSDFEILDEMPDSQPGILVCSRANHTGVNSISGFCSRCGVLVWHHIDPPGNVQLVCESCWERQRAAN